MVVVNPNNPTGSLIPSSVILKQIAQNPGKFFIVDESFIDFSGEKSLEVLAPASLDNFVVLKSLSKVLGIPGVRLGYVFTNNVSLHRYFMGNIPVWNINSIAEFFLEILLKHRNEFASSIDKTVRDREDFSNMLLDCLAVERVFQSSANFLLVKLAFSASEMPQVVRMLLNDYNIYAKSCSGKFNDEAGYLRIAVRLPEENAVMANALNAIWSNLKSERQGGDVRVPL